MSSKTKKSERIDSEQREQYEYAHNRIKQKRNLFRHFIFFLAGSVLFIVLSAILHLGEEFLVEDWYIWAILIWFFIFLVHIFNVFIINTFMGKEWEDRQVEKLKNKQTERIAKLQKRVDSEFESPKKIDEVQTPLPPNQ